MPQSTVSSSPPAESARPPAARPLDYGVARPRLPGSDKLIDILKTLAWVAPLTILIWIYAEREQSRTEPSVSFPIEVRTPDGSRIISLKDPADHNVVATLSGPRTILDRVIHDLQSGGPDRAAIQVYVDPKLPKGDNPLETARYIANNPLFTRQGISVKDISPRTLRVDIDDFETRSLEVRAPQDLPSAQDVRFIPATVKVRAPSHLFKDADAAKQLYVVADLSKLDVLNQPGHHDVSGVPVTPAFKGEQITVEPQTITASLDVKKPKAELDLDGIVIYPNEPIPVRNSYVLVVNPLTVPHIKVEGPQEQIDRLKRGDFNAVAVLDLTRADADKGSGERRLRFELPPGVEVISDPALYTVKFTLVERPKE